MADVAEEVAAPSDDTQHLNAIFGNIRGYRARIAELEDLLAKSKQESAVLRAELAEIRSGKRVTIVIDGVSMSVTKDGLVSSIEEQGTQSLTINNEWLQSAIQVQPNGAATRNPLADSFVL